MIALLFDLDGTLVDSIDLILASFRHAFETVQGASPADEELIVGIGTPLLAQFQPYARSEAELDALVGAYRAFQRDQHDRLLREFAGTRETLGILKGRNHPMALVTSKMVDMAMRALDFTGLRGFMDVVVGCDSCTRHKPDPEPVHVALRQLGLAPRDALFVGDSPHDIVAGNAAGVATVAALWGPFSRATLEAARPTHLLDRVTLLPDLVERIQWQRSAAAAEVGGEGVLDRVG
jgi:pyrophosphatase PpaX